MSPRKCLLLILDGLGDRQYPELGQRTPLQAAHTPNLDRLAELGGNGLYHASRSGEPLPSETAHFALFGYSLDRFPGRGPLEALGAGLAIDPGQVVVLAHFVSASSHDGCLFVDTDRPTTVDQTEIQALFREVADFEQDGVRIRLHQTKGLFGVLLLEGQTSSLITDSNPMRDHAPATDIAPLFEAVADPDAQRTAGSLRSYLSWAHRCLDKAEINRSRRDRGQPPINGLVTQRAGYLLPQEPFLDRTGLKAASLGSGPMYRGLASLLGFEAVDLPAAADVQSDFSARLDRAREILSDFDFVHVHTKAPDEAAHSGDCRAKREVISQLDRSIGAHMDLLADDQEILAVISSDHSTPCAGPMIHSGEPVPVIMRGTTIRRDGVKRYDEIDAALGCLGPLRGPELMQLILNGLDMAVMRGIRETPDPRHFWPGPAPGLRID